MKRASRSKSRGHETRQEHEGVLIEQHFTPDTVSQSSIAFLFQLCRAADARWPKDTTKHCSVLLGLTPYQPNYRKKGSELPLLLCASVEPRLATAHDGNAAERTHSQQIAQCCCLKSPGRLGRPSISALRWCASAQRLSSRSSRRERLRITSGITCKKTRTAEVTICIIPERTARTPPTVTELDLVLNGTYAELLPLQSTAHLEVANPCLGDHGKRLDVSSPMKGTASSFIRKHHPSEDCTHIFHLKRVASGSEAKWR